MLSKCLMLGKHPLCRWQAKQKYSQQAMNLQNLPGRAHPNTKVEAQPVHCTRHTIKTFCAHLRFAEPRCAKNAPPNTHLALCIRDLNLPLTCSESRRLGHECSKQE